MISLFSFKEKKTFIRRTKINKSFKLLVCYFSLVNEIINQKNTCILKLFNT